MNVALHHQKNPSLLEGWRSWNCYHTSVTQEKMEIVMDKMAQRTREVGGVNKSLVDVGYTRAGLDDNWQVCTVVAQLFCRQHFVLCSFIIFNISC